MITRGTTPTVRLNVTDFELKDTDEIYLYFSQDKKMRCKKVTPDVIVEGTTVKATLTQEDTFKLKKGKVKIQFRLKTASGTVLASSIAYDQVVDVEDEDEVI